MTKIAVFASGEGTNLQAVIDAVHARRIRGQIVLVVSSNPEAGALSRARRAGIDILVCHPRDYGAADEYSARLASECKNRGVDLICLAGFIHQLKEPLLKEFRWRILNVHPALLPAFGGKGMFGRHVHEAVLRAGARVSGCTVHFVDEQYDHGWTVCQSAVQVLPSDTPETLAARVRAVEHWLYPKAVALFCEKRLDASESGVRILPSPLERSTRVKRALLSAADKRGLVEFAKALEDMDVEIVSTSGTAKLLQESGVLTRPIDTMTGFPEILSGRVKTLHPSVHGGILFRRQDPEQAREAELMGIEPIDLVAVNLYPFAQTAARLDSPWTLEAIEAIDIGGVALIRAAAKNFEHVAVLVSPTDYASAVQEMESSQGHLSVETRKRLALTAFRHTADYDAMIAKAWRLALEARTLDPVAASPAGGALPAGESPAQARTPELFPPTLTVALTKTADLRYGENPHQKAALYCRTASPKWRQLHGKELSYNNLLDASAAWEAVCEFQEPAAVVVKHLTPCGAATAESVSEALAKAWACDPLSAFGGIVALNRPLPVEAALALSGRFLEVVVAPGFDDDALLALRKKPNLRLILRQDPPSHAPVLRSIGSEVLVAEPDHVTFGGSLKVATRRPPSKEEEEALRFAWMACKHVKSNAVVLAAADATVGIGAGQMSRVDAVKMAGMKFQAYLKDNPKPAVLVMASDGFFPFRDGVDAAASLGATAVIQPGGSVKDPEVVAAADEKGLAMVLTGVRHFRH
ncbi:MAG: bifunctional phosphoribosylaminoimidazolecarboxamide formyltransferase/IMP cyclohydrolase [Elusimicrobia bacterium]|nr:bifunctional phosphoribosylaminoimidazolecarboxamide formyltransferase/IMP cyclohydrolase [Elusimicrobiota bacterium]